MSSRTSSRTSSNSSLNDSPQRNKHNSHQSVLDWIISIIKKGVSITKNSIDYYCEENNIIHPLEIKKSATPDKREIKKYSVLDKAELDRGNGGIVCMCEEPIPIDEKNCFIPSNLI